MTDVGNQNRDFGHGICWIVALEFSKYFEVIGYDINKKRIAELIKGEDLTREVCSNELKDASNLIFRSDLLELKKCNVYIITVPTPIDNDNKPNLHPLLEATKDIGSLLKKGDTVIYESTVFPGATEEECIPLLENISGLSLNQDFYVGYSPERINPGDKDHKIHSIVKVTSGSCDEAASFVDGLYKTIVTAGTFKVANIKEAEAAKVIENTQRDLNMG